MTLPLPCALRTHVLLFDDAQIALISYSATRKILYISKLGWSMVSPWAHPSLSLSRMRTKGPTITRKLIFTHDRVTPITLTWKSMESRQAVAVAVAALARPSVCTSRCQLSPISGKPTLGRVAAGAIAEKYLKLAYGIEVIAFVSSVGKVHLPSTIAPVSNNNDDDDDVPDALSEDFRKLLSTITREEVDKFATRCPHPETSERMTKVLPPYMNSVPPLGNLLSRPAYHPRQRSPGLYWWHGDLRHPQRPRRTRRACLRQIRGDARARDALYPRHQIL